MNQLFENGQNCWQISVQTSCPELHPTGNLKTTIVLHYCRPKVWPNWALSSNSSSWSASALYLPEPPGQKDTLFKSHQISPVWLGKNFLRKFFLLNTEDWISDCMVTKTKTWCCALVACAGPFPRAGAPSIRGRSSGSRKGPWIKENADFTMQGGEL